VDPAKVGTWTSILQSSIPVSSFTVAVSTVYSQLAIAPIIGSRTCTPNTGPTPSTRQLFRTRHQLPTANCQLPTANCQLPTANCQLPNCPLPTAHCPLPTAHCPLPTANCQLPTANCQLPTAN
jgi:hypothetical protein